MKLILLDVDGTLISYNGVIPQSVYTACQLAHQKGNLIYLVTGRTFGHLEEHIMKINPDGVIGGNGAFIKVEDKFIKSVTMNPQDQKEIVDYLLKKGNEFFIETTNSIYGSKGFPQKMQEVFAKYGHKGKKKYQKFTQ